MLQIEFESLPAPRRIRQFRRKEAIIAPASLLRLVHRGIGGLEQVPGVLAVLGELADADAGADPQVVPFDLERRAQRSQHLLGHRLDVMLRLHHGQADHKFVSAQARDDVALPQSGSQTRRNRLQQTVAHLMSEGVVHVLETVQVQHEDHNPSLVAGRQRDRLTQQILQQSAIRQSGQRVVKRHVADAQIRQLAVGDVTRDAHGAHDPAAPVLHRYLGRQHPSLVPVGPGFLLFLAGQRDAGANDRLLVLQRLAGVFGAEHVGVGLVHRLRRIGQPEVVGHGPVDAQETAAAILEVHVVRDMIPERVQEVPPRFGVPVGQMPQSHKPNDNGRKSDDDCNSRGALQRSANHVLPPRVAGDKAHQLEDERAPQ